MRLPSPPPYEKRFIQMLSSEAEQAIRTRSGDLYETLVKELFRMNQQYFTSPREVEELLPSFLWPPWPPECLCTDFPHLPQFPTHLRMDGQVCEVLVSDPVQYINLFTQRSAIRMAISQEFGGAKGMARMREELATSGGSAEEFDELVYAVVRAVEEQTRPL